MKHLSLPHTHIRFRVVIAILALMSLIGCPTNTKPVQLITLTVQGSEGIAVKEPKALSVAKGTKWADVKAKVQEKITVADTHTLEGWKIGKADGTAVVDTTVFDTDTVVFALAKLKNTHSEQEQLITLTVGGSEGITVKEPKTLSVPKGAKWADVKAKVQEKITIAGTHTLEGWKIGKADGTDIVDTTVFDKDTVVFAVAKPKNSPPTPPSPSDQDNVIEDTLLRKVINKNLGKDRKDDQKITIKELESLTELSLFLKADGKADFSEDAAVSILGTPKSLKGTPDFKFATTYGIKSIKGLEYAKNLQKLKLNENEISDINPLAKLTKMTYLELQRNRIVDVSPLQNLVNLTFLKLYNNLIEDINPLKNLTKLEGLDLHYNVTVKGDENNKVISKGITDISVVENMPNLTFLDVSANRITDVKVITALDKITDLDFSGNMVSDYEGMADYIIPRLKKALNEGEGSINFYAQMVPFDTEVKITKKENTPFSSPFKGIEVLSTKAGEAFEDTSFHFFQDVKTNIEGINAAYDKDTQSVLISLTDDAVSKYNTQSITLTVTLSAGEFSWTISGIKVDIAIDVQPQVEANGLPRVFDLREKGFVTPIKNQYKDGGCRSFASLAALESHIKMKEGIDIDLSENNMEMRHGFYFQGKKAREGRNRESDIPYLINGIGPILEEHDSYTPMQDENGQKPEYLTRAQVDALTPVTDKDRASLVMGFEFLKKVDTKNLTSEEDEKLVQIKTAIKDHGAVVANIYMSHDGNKTFPYSNAKYYNPTTHAYYADGEDGAYGAGCSTGNCNNGNHAITIVGWNDNFSKDNFTTKPPIDGAWIVKDAQTTEFGENGYFYVSFASVSMGEDAYVFTDVRQGNEYDGIYQHDEVAFSKFIASDLLATKTVLFNRYKPTDNGQRLEEIGFYTTKPEAEYEVYLIEDFEAFKTEAENCSDEDEFYEFIKKYKIFFGTESAAGYHTKKLGEKAITLAKNKAFALGIWTKNSDSEDPEHEWDMVLDKKETGKLGHNSVVKKNETFAFAFDMFTDINQFSNTQTGNACIKGYYKKQ
ncbi:MAG: leucine-rich repeat domain-containing protein [Treponema sp.]